MGIPGIEQTSLTAAAAGVSRGLRGLFSPRLWHGVGRLALLYVSVVWFLYRLLTRVSAWFRLTHGRVPAGRPTTGRSAGPMNRRW